MEKALDLLSGKGILEKVAMDYLRSKIKSFLEGLRNKRDSIRDSSFGLRMVVVFFLVFLSFYSVNNFNSAFNFLKQTETFAETKENNLFISPLGNFLTEVPEFILINDSFVKASPPPTFFTPQALGVSADFYEPEEETRTEIIEHIVQSAETLSSLAIEYNISLETILWANGLTSNSSLKIGQKLVILPVSGVLHYVQKDENIGYLAQLYKADAGQIVSLNELKDEGRIYFGDLLVVPGGTMPAPSVKKQAPSSVRVPLASRYFIAPVSLPYIITQGLHWNNAIDFSHQGYACGKSVIAAAGGTVQRVAYGRTGYGNYVTILHPNGVVTLYAHLMNNSISVSSGQTVLPGEGIGLIGNTGYTIGQTGCHVHFEVRGAANPFAK